jgi:hypothetical protein
MHPKAQEKFRQRVKIWLVANNRSVTTLAAKIRRRRDTVSKAINGGRFPRVQDEIIQEIER